jgi:hypothetical protein
VRRFPALPVLLVAAVSVATLAGCSGGAAEAPAPSAPAADAPLPKYATLADLGAATAAQQKIDKTAKITLNGGLAGQSQSGLTGDGVLRFDDAGASMQITQRIQAGGGTPQELELVVLPDDAWIRPPAGPAGLPPGKTWLRIKPTATDPVSAQFNQMIQAIRDNADPTKSFAQFGDAISIVETAEEPLDGLRTMRYKLRVDLAKAADRQPDAGLKKSLQDSVQSGLATLDYTLWIDAQNRLARVLVDQPLPRNGGTFSLDARYRDWGQPVQIDPPPADQVLER